MVGIIAAVLHEPPSIIEKWPPSKTMAYYLTAVEVRNLLGG